MASCAGKQFSYSVNDLPSAHLYDNEVGKSCTCIPLSLYDEYINFSLMFF